MMRIALVVSMILAACVPVPTTPFPLESFAEAARFLPHGMESFAFMREWPVLSTKDEHAVSILAGCDFREPSRFGWGPSNSIRIVDVARGGAGRILAAHLQGCDSHAENIDGQACWHVPDELSLDSDQWYAVIDDRFLLAAEQKSTLALAMAATGSLPSVLAPFGELAFLPNDADGVILSLPRPGEDAGGGQPIPSAPMMFVSLQDPWRLAVYSKAALSADYRDLLGQVWGYRDPDVTNVGGWMCHLGETVEPVSKPDQLGYIFWRMLFGIRLIL